MRLGAGFGGPARGIVGLPGDPHLDEATLVAQCENGGAHPSINGCLAVQNDANAGHLPSCSKGDSSGIALDCRQSYPRALESFG